MLTAKHTFESYRVDNVRLAEMQGLKTQTQSVVPTHLVALETDPSEDTADAVSSVTSSLSGSSDRASGL